jgi:hypothetical protein
MRFVTALPFLALLAVSPVLRAADLTLVRVWPEYRAADSFARISEFFSGVENTGGQTVLRSQPAERAGFYFLVRTETKTAITGARVELQVLLPGVEQPKTFSFPADVPAGGHVMLAGLTGKDWPGEKIAPVAWHLAVLAADGTTLASGQSFLWAKPAAAKK